MKKTLLYFITIIPAVYLLICVLLYFFQEKLIFFPEKLNKDFKFTFTQPFEELHFKTQDNLYLNGLLFKADSSKGLIFYLHGNAGALNSWGEVAKTYTDLHYDVLILDYRGFGKSEGNIESEKQLFQDLQMVYNTMKLQYTEDKIIVLGYSIGTGAAAKIASVNKPRSLILQAPYYSLADMMQHTYPFIPGFILKYPFKTNEFIQYCSMPIVIFHGNRDEVIYYNSSVKLKAFLKKTDTLITLNNQNHNGITENPDYKIALAKILAR